MPSFMYLRYTVCCIIYVFTYLAAIGMLFRAFLKRRNTTFIL